MQTLAWAHFCSGLNAIRVVSFSRLSVDGVLMKIRIREVAEFPVVERVLTLYAGWAAGCATSALYLRHGPIPGWMDIQLLVAWIAIIVYYFKIKE